MPCVKASGLSVPNDEPAGDEQKCSGKLQNQGRPLSLPGWPLSAVPATSSARRISARVPTRGQSLSRTYRSNKPLDSIAASAGRLMSSSIDPAWAEASSATLR